MTGFSGCSARVASDQTVAVLASAINSRRLMASPRRGLHRAWKEYHILDREMCATGHPSGPSPIVRFVPKADIAISSAVPVNSSILRRQGLDPEVLLNRFHLSPPAWGYSADGSVVRNSNQRLKSKTVNSPNVVTTSAVRCMMSAADTQLAWPPPVV